MKSKLLTLLCCIIITTPCFAQNETINCNTPVERFAGDKGITITLPCKDLVLLDLETYTKYRYFKKQYAKLDTTVSGYTEKQDSLSAESQKNIALLEEKVVKKEAVIQKYKANSAAMLDVLEECKKNSEGFVKKYREVLEINAELKKKNKNLRTQRNILGGISGGLGVLLVILLL